MSITRPLRHAWVAAFAVLSLLAVAGTVVADPARDAARAACKDDLQRLCSDVKPGGGRILAYLRDHEKDLSPTCRQALANAGH